jgi:hypothetical protein
VLDEMFDELPFNFLPDTNIGHAELVSEKVIQVSQLDPFL